MKIGSILKLMICIALVFMVNNLYAANSMKQNFDDPGSNYGDETDGSLQMKMHSGNTYASYSSGDTYLWSSIYFTGVQLSLDESILTFDYKFDVELNFPAASPPWTVNDISVAMNYEFLVSVYDIATYDIFRYGPDQNGNDPTALVDPTSPAAEMYGFNTSIITSASEVEGFTRATVDLTDFILSEGLAGTPVDIYFTIAGGWAYYNYGAGDDLSQDEFSASLEIDNISLGGSEPDPVPEPAAYALFCFGLWFIAKRVKAKNN